MCFEERQHDWKNNRNFPADLLFSIANKAIAALNANTEENKRHPFVLVNFECALENPGSAEGDWYQPFPLS